MEVVKKITKEQLKIIVKQKKKLKKLIKKNGIIKTCRADVGGCCSN